MRRKRKHYQHGLQREKRTVWRPRNITDSARKKIAWYNPDNTIYLGDQYMNDGRKKQELSETRFPTSNFISPSVAPLHMMTWNYVPSIVNL